MAMRIGELARRSGVGVSTLRAWERRFNFLSPERTPAGHRLYTDDDLNRVEAVLRLVSDGLTLASAMTRVVSVGSGALPDGEGEALLYGQILQAADQGVWVSKNGRTRYANRRAASMMGYPLEELVSVPVLDFFDPADIPAIVERTAQVRAGGRLNFRSRLRRADGSWFLAEITSTALLDSTGQYDGAVALITDVSGQELAETQARLRTTLLDSIGEAVAASNAAGEIVYINGAAEKLFGWREEEVLGRQGGELLASPTAQHESSAIHNALLRGRRYVGPLRMTRRDGTDFDAHISCTPAHDEHGAVVGLVAVINDLTEQDQKDRDVRTRELQIETLALLGTEARRYPDRAGPTILFEAIEAARRLLKADKASMLVLNPNTQTFDLRVASPEPEVSSVVPAGSRSLSGYVAWAGRVVVADDLAGDGRFDQCVEELGPTPSASAIGAPIFGPSGVLGVVVAESVRRRAFEQRDAHFLQGVANIVGVALQAT